MNKGNIATILLNNPGYAVSNVEELKKAAAKIFGWDGDFDKVEVLH